MNENTILDKFTILSETNDHQAKLECHNCQCTFVADFNVLNSAHVTWELGLNTHLIVTCPGCKAEARMDQRDYDIAVLTLTKLEILREVTAIRGTADIPFTHVNAEVREHEATLHCSKCNNDFIVRSALHPTGAQNMVIKNELMSEITCPHCKVTDKLELASNKHKKQLAQLMEQFHDVSMVLNFLRKASNEKN